MPHSVKFYAHSSTERDDANWQKLSDHLNAVGSIAGGMAAHFDASELATVAGQLHDVGKYCVEFQNRLRGDQRRVDHSTWGARIAKARYEQFWPLLAYGIAGHHAGLADGIPSDNEQRLTPLSERLRKPSETRLDPQWEQEIALAERPEFPAFKQRRGNANFQLSLLGRMLFSCLVDADFLDTDAFYRGVEGRPKRDRAFPDIAALQAVFDRYLSQPRFRNREGVNAARADILSNVRRQAESSPGLFSLSVPTGGGKTLASMAFALDHARHHGLRRVIFVIPFTSIIEQNAAVFREALGPLGDAAVLEHHSAFSPTEMNAASEDAGDKLRLASENWDAPVVVTTAVQFFESLFANKPSRCRKLHNIANSVVVLDEAQTLPMTLLRPCVALIDELARNYNTSLVLCTATQPALLEREGFVGGLTGVRELAPAPEALHTKMERVTVEHVGPLTDDELIDRIAASRQVLCIVNNRRHARSLYERIRQFEGAAHLTTLMCARHRSDSLRTIRQRLTNDQPCRLISTSLIEAGVDVDFPLVYRADAGLDSIAQAAGRCNREGRRSKASSFVRVFSVADDWQAPIEIEQYAQACLGVFRRHAATPLSMDAIRDYFQDVYWQRARQLDAHQLLSCIEAGGLDSIPYEFIARKFRMIDSNMVPVIVPYSSEVSELLMTLSHADYVGSIARLLQPYLVQVPEFGLKALRSAGAISPVNESRFGDQFLELVASNLYDPACGLTWDDPEYLSAERCVL